MKRIVIGVSGASGAPYAHRLLTHLASRDDVEADVVFTKTARLVWTHEVDVPLDSLGLRIYGPGDMTAPFASGSSRYDGMAIVPCSAGAMGRIANGISADLLGRAADVMLKERRPLVICLREAPYSLVHVRNMEQLLVAGARILPASPNFYSGAQTVQDLLDTVVGRVLDQLGIENDLVTRWSGL